MAGLSAAAGSLIQEGPTTLVLTGTNTYDGGTVVNGGTLVVTSAAALEGQGSLTIGAGGTFIFDPSSISGSPVASGGAAVPEPGTLALLAACALAPIAFRQAATTASRRART